LNLKRKQQSNVTVKLTVLPHCFILLGSRYTWIKRSKGPSNRYISILSSSYRF